MLIDAHCHLFEEYYPDLEEVIKRMGNNKIIVSGINHQTNQEVLKLIEKYSNVYGTIGIHPSEVNNYELRDLEFVQQNLDHPKIVGLGEIGLDYHWTKETKEQQKELFEKQLIIAKDHKKPVIVHSRSAVEDTYEILKNEYEKGSFKIFMHCFGYDLNWALKFIKLGSLLGIGGVITFKNAPDLVEIVKKVGLRHLLLETDSPYLTPVPYRGQRNEPGNIKYVAKKVADLINLPIEEVAKVTTTNAKIFFNL